ncbi:hypothetical protein [Catellatospora methionotrophica]|uniref:hypothetical protein n=1 Tax=Catellatospora methionotrophica TaxID=121620 RepID=UPI00340F8525
MLSVLLVDGATARFTARRPVTALLETLRPVEAAFLAAVVDPDGDDPGWDPSGVLDLAVLARLPHRGLASPS